MNDAVLAVQGLRTWLDGSAGTVRAIDGVSLVTNYRTSFANEIRKTGLDNLIAKLAQRNQSITPAKPPQAAAP